MPLASRPIARLTASAQFASAQCQPIAEFFARQIERRFGQALSGLVGQLERRGTHRIDARRLVFAKEADSRHIIRFFPGKAHLSFDLTSDLTSEAGMIFNSRRGVPRADLLAPSRSRISAALLVAALLLPLFASLAPAARADEPYARSKEYDLSSVRTHLWFDLDQRKIRGEASENISALRDDLTDDHARFGRPHHQQRYCRRQDREFLDRSRQAHYFARSSRQNGRQARVVHQIRREARRKAFISSCPTPITRASRRKSGRRAKRKIRAITSRCTTIRMTG